ncbi:MULTISPECIES: DUF397 domain-containing protein [Catenuloplanes]|uniref:DUF397 domain-containing protein n=1 Tax=Catenuloplanes niger TaxID=587534 RepID=A0AAE3ZMH5_9ACTN|nr:DUF397 domain-containing protein [Catenuloplanes niger]MDR7320828.1 hypothetical protein [Catenuloplanes niger]
MSESMPGSRTGWRKSNRSGPADNCVEVRDEDSTTAVRDSKDPDGDMLRFSRNAWFTFVADLRNR